MQQKNRLFSAKLILILLFFIEILAFPAFAAGELDLYVLHTNDFHGYLLPYEDKRVAPPPMKIGGAAYIAGLIEQHRAIYRENTLLLDAGDIAQGTPVSNIFRGVPVIDYMNTIHYDAMCLGNHEFDWGQDTLRDMMGRLKFPVLCANLIKESSGNTPDFVKPYHIFKVDGARVGIIGLITPTTPLFCFPRNIFGFIFREPKEIVRLYMDVLHANGVNVIGVLSHLGVEGDIQLAKDVPGISFIVGGHSHTILNDPKFINGTIITQTGAYGMYLGCLHMLLDKSNGKVLSYTDKNELIPIIDKNIAPDKKIEALIARYYDKIKPEMEEVLGYAERDFSKVPSQGRGDTPLGNLVTDLLRRMTKTDVFFYNAGGLRAPINAGKITRDDIFKVLPFDDYIVTMDLPGKYLMELLQSASKKEKDKEVQVSGITYTLHPDRKLDGRVSGVLVNGQPIEPENIYKIGTIDFLYFGGDGLTEFKYATNAVVGEILARDLLYLAIKEEGKITASNGEKRIVIDNNQ